MFAFLRLLNSKMFADGWNKDRLEMDFNRVPLRYEMKTRLSSVVDRFQAGWK